MNIADQFFKEQEASENLRRQIKEYLEEAHAHDPIANFRKKLLADGTATEAELDAIDQQMADEIEAAYEFADSSPYPDPSEAFTDVYSEDNERCVAR